MSAKIAYLFPGQGAQEVGMGRDLFKTDEGVRELIAIASEATGVDLKRIVLKGPASRLADTALLQPAMSVISLSLWRRLSDAGISAAAVAGHSVGELSALAASGMADVESMVELAALRGRLMAEAASVHTGSMAALSGASHESVAASIESMNRSDLLSVGAVNGPKQVVITGDAHQVSDAAGSLSRSLGLTATPLRVSGAWHSPHMTSAIARFQEALAHTQLCRAEVPMVFNRSGGVVSTPESVPTLLAEQLVRPVRWDLVMSTLVGMGVTVFVEIGPGRVLRGLVRLNDPRPDVVVYNVSDLRSLDRVCTAFAANRNR
jgi:[acyl-carrier-protein] S-malonyltransferase